MACLALSIQPLRGPDILLQTREWFPPARAAAASYSFQATREAFDTAASSANTDIVGDDALTASSGQVVVGEDSKFRVVYRLVNSVYVLGISSADQDDCSNNVFDCTSTVNQAVSILVAACRGVDVTAEKVNRKYAEVYLALDAILHGASSTQLSNLMSALGNAGTAAAAIVAAGGNATTDAGAASLAEVQARGADTWGTARQGPLERVSTAQVLAHTSFELPEALLQAGDAVMEAQGVAPRKDDAPAAAPGPEAAPEEPRDPFALPAAKGDDFSAGFTRAVGSTDSVAALAELSAGLATLDGGEGGPGFGAEDAAGFQDFEAGEDAFGGDQLVAGFGEEAFGGGFDGLALEESAAPGPDAAASGDALALALAASTGPAIGGEWTAAEVRQKGPATENGTVAGLPAGAAGSSGSGAATRAAVLWVAEAVHAEFHGAALRRAGLQGELRLQAPPRKMAATSEEALQLAFRLDGAAGVKTVAVNKQTTTRVGPGVFHATIPPALGAGPPSPLVLAKYRLTAAATPLPMRLHLAVRRRPGGRVAVLLQYVANPALLAPLPNVLFLLSLPFSPEALHFSPRGVWVKKERQLRWTVPAVVPGAPPGRLRVALTGVAPQQSLAALNARVVAVSPGYLLSAMFLRPATEGGAPPFVAGEHTWSTGVYLAYPAEKATSVLGDEFSALASGAQETAPPEEALQNESMETGVPLAVPVEEEDGSMQEGAGQNSDFFQQPGTAASDGYDHVESASPAESQKVLRFDSFGFDALGDEPARRPLDELNRQKSSAFDSPKQSAAGISDTGRSAQPFSSQSLNFF